MFRRAASLNLDGLDEVFDFVWRLILERLFDAQDLQVGIARRGAGDGYGFFGGDFVGGPKGIEVIGGRSRQAEGVLALNAVE